MSQRRSSTGVDRRSFLQLILQLAGGYGQIHYRAIYGAPGHSPRAQSVDIAKA